eukprot:239307_1
MAQQKEDGSLIERRIEWKCPDRKNHTVVLYGSWNRFRGDNKLEYKGKQTFACIVKLPLGTHIYRFKIDGEEWQTDNIMPKHYYPGAAYNQICVAADDIPHSQQYTNDIFARTSIKQVSESILHHEMILTFGYIRENTFDQNFPTSIMNYITVFAFYVPGLRYEYKSDFDKNGFVYSIATHYGQKQWANPVEQDRIRIKSSRWAVGNVDDIVTRTRIGYCSSYPTANSWLRIDFGANNRIKPAHYTLQHDCRNGYYLRTWNFQGSNNGTQWDTLRNHWGDSNINNKYDTHTWTIDVDEYYQMFRILMTGLNSDGLWHLSCSEFEIYGHSRSRDFENACDVSLRANLFS